MFRVVHGDASANDKATRRVGGVFVRDPVIVTPMWVVIVRQIFHLFGLLIRKAVKHPVFSALLVAAVWLRLWLGHTGFGWLLVGVLALLCAWAVGHWPASNG